MQSVFPCACQGITALSKPINSRKLGDVHMTGVEPARSIRTLGPEPSASTNSATCAFLDWATKLKKNMTSKEIFFEFFASFSGPL